MRAIISIGSNIMPSENLRKSIRLLAKQARLCRISRVYRSPAENRPEQPLYYNCAVLIETGLSPERLRGEVLAVIEKNLGRIRTADKFAARTIDLDLVACFDAPESAGGCATVAPTILNHPYVALPLFELAPELKVGEGGISIGKAVAGVPHDSLEILSGYSESIFREFGMGTAKNQVVPNGRA
jgi:2-amino-4-hydroxy-6-hydroxymethyldihydropteridine diphosphokinase